MALKLNIWHADMIQMHSFQYMFSLSMLKAQVKPVYFATYSTRKWKQPIFTETSHHWHPVDSCLIILKNRYFNQKWRSFQSPHFLVDFWHAFSTLVPRYTRLLPMIICVLAPSLLCDRNWSSLKRTLNCVTD